MLEATLSTKFIPGTNLSGHLACADWRYLLPGLQLENVLCIGIPSIRHLRVLSGISTTIRVVSNAGKQLEKLQEEIYNQKMANIRITRVKKYVALPIDTESMDLIFLAGSHERSTFIRKADMLSEIKNFLKPRGVVYVELQGISARLRQGKFLKMVLQQGLGVKGGFWLTPVSGELRTALPLRDNQIAKYFFTTVLFGQSFKKRVLSKVGKLLSEGGLITALSPRHALLLQRSSASQVSTNGRLLDVPLYLSRIAENSDIDLSHYTFGLNARGKYNTNKVIFFLFNKRSKKAEIVIKMTRASEFNYRLENEYRILSKLKETGFAEADTFPEALFFDYHNNLAVIGIKAIHGQPFRTRTQATADCPIARNAINWLFRLGSVSVNREAASKKEVSDALYQLFRSFTEIYQLTEEEKRFMTEQIDSVGRGTAAFPMVFQHGDPGIWNMMVREKDKVVVIDWEAGEVQGIPLWDLFYFFRTYASWVSRQQGSNDALNNFSQHFLNSSELLSLLSEVVNRYCAEIHLDKEMVKPLFYTCWMHRALKESARLPTTSLQGGHYLNLLRLCIREQNNAALISLFR